jgi:hypothetical protein
MQTPAYITRHLLDGEIGGRNMVAQANIVVLVARNQAVTLWPTQGMQDTFQGFKVAFSGM